MSHALHSDAVYVGIDVAKAELVLDVRPTPAPWAATNDAAGVRDVVPRLAEDGAQLSPFE
jgi:hypothetical protein